MTKQSKKKEDYPIALEPRDQNGIGYMNPLEPRDATVQSKPSDPLGHKLGPGLLCGTEDRGFATPQNKSLTEIVVHVSEGFIPLWEPNRLLRWQFNENSMQYFRYPELAKRYIRGLFADSLNAWGDSAPIRFREVSSGWDFEIFMSNADNCNSNGCTLASAFFPDGGRHRLRLYPKMFQQSGKEQIDTFIHEVGHVFGLRHFFADVSEQAWPSEIFGEHKAFSIMNYGSMSELTKEDKRDLKALYSAVWRGDLTCINGTPIVQFKPFHYFVD